MTDELGREELLEWLDRFVFSNMGSTVNRKCAEGHEHCQAYQQIKALIQKPGVTEEFIAEKAGRFLLSFPGTYTHQHSSQHQSQLRYIKDFIRKLVVEIHGRK